MIYREYSANEIARYVLTYLKHKGQFINNLKLQPILYFIQAEYILQFNKAAFSEDIIKEDWGIKIPSVYHNFKYLAGLNILPCNYKSFNPILSIKERNVLEDIINTTIEYTFTELINLIKSHEPWLKSFYKNSIDKNLIKEFYQK